jgi:LysR family tcuABC transcriptional regulator
MELSQLRYFVRVVELGSMSRAALDLNLVQSALSQQISRLEGELSTRLLQRTAKGVTPTEAGMAFFREAQLACAMPTRPRVRRAGAADGHGERGPGAHHGAVLGCR